MCAYMLIDFGTTFSGCCYAFSKDGNDEIIDITKWYTKKPPNDTNSYRLTTDIGPSNKTYIPKHQHFHCIETAPPSWLRGDKTLKRQP